MGSVNFGAPRELVLWLRDSFGCDTFIETGTNRAETSVWASDHFKQVVTIEGYEPLYTKAVEAYGNRKNIQFLKGDSRFHLNLLAKNLVNPAIFWLDAHWCGEHTFGKADECPVIGELEAINASDIGHIVLVDDARLFLAPPPAPHEADHWPDLATLCASLSSTGLKRYVSVHSDVVIAIPWKDRRQLLDFLRDEVANDIASPQRRAPSERWWRNSMPVRMLVELLRKH